MFGLLSGQLRQLLSHSEDFPGELGEFLEPHDNLSWIHQVATQDYTKVRTGPWNVVVPVNDLIHCFL